MINNSQHMFIFLLYKSPLYAFVREALLHHFQGLRLLEALSSSPHGFQCPLWGLMSCQQIGKQHGGLCVKAFMDQARN